MVARHADWRFSRTRPKSAAVLDLWLWRYGQKRWPVRPGLFYLSQGTLANQADFYVAIMLTFPVFIEETTGCSLTGISVKKLLLISVAYDLPARSEQQRTSC